jgi:hypothetical protein
MDSSSRHLGKKGASSSSSSSHGGGVGDASPDPRGILRFTPNQHAEVGAPSFLPATTQRFLSPTIYVCVCACVCIRAADAVCFFLVVVPHTHQLHTGKIVSVCVCVCVCCWGPRPPNLLPARSKLFAPPVILSSLFLTLHFFLL